MEFNLLIALIDHEGATTSRLSLLSEVWGHSAAVVTRTVDTHIAELRRKLEEDPARPAHIRPKGRIPLVKLELDVLELDVRVTHER